MKCTKCGNGELHVCTDIACRDGGDESRFVFCDACCCMFMMEFGSNPKYGKDAVRDADRNMADAHRAFGRSETEARDTISRMPTVDAYRISGLCVTSSGYQDLEIL